MGADCANHKSTFPTSTLRGMLSFHLASLSSGDVSALRRPTGRSSQMIWTNTLLPYLLTPTATLLSLSCTKLILGRIFHEDITPNSVHGLSNAANELYEIRNQINYPSFSMFRLVECLCPKVPDLKSHNDKRLYR